MHFSSLLVAVTLVCAHSAQAAPIQGYLADRYCIDGRFAPDGADMLLRPQDHTVMCALLPQCIASGFVILMFTRGSTPTQYGQMYNLTTRGNQMAVDYLRLFRTPTRNDIAVEVDGTIGSDGSLEPTYIRDVTGAAQIGETTVPIIGYLADRYCIDRIIAPDGANMLTSPQDHSVMCALLPQCIASGWSILTDTPNPLRTSYGIMYNFSMGSQTLGEQLMRALNASSGPMKTDIRVAALGTIDAGGVFTVSSMTELNTQVTVVAGSMASALQVSVLALVSMVLVVLL